MRSIFLMRDSSGIFNLLNFSEISSNINVLLVVQVIKDNSHTFHNCVYIVIKPSIYITYDEVDYEDKIRNRRI